MQRYLALLRGINVGGKSIVGMADLRAALENCGLHRVETYIQSGNVFFDAAETDTDILAKRVEQCVATQFDVTARTAVFTQEQWAHIIANAPTWWGKDPAWKHNLLIVLRPYRMPDVVAAIGTLKPDIEAIEPGDGVLYQSMSRALFGRTTTGKLAGSPIYRQLTIRNYNTATKLLTLF